MVCQLHLTCEKGLFEGGHIQVRWYYTAGLTGTLLECGWASAG